MKKIDQTKSVVETGEAGVEKPGRRAALRKLGLFGLAAYAAPALMSLSDAEAASRSRSNSRSRSGGKRRKKRKNKKRNRSRSRT